MLKCIRKKYGLPVILMLITSLTILLSQSLSYANPQYAETGWFIKDINIETIDSYVRFFTSLKSRFTGYPGFYEAADYIESYLRNLKLNITVEEYEVAVPIEEYAYIEFSDGTKIPAHALYPLGGNTGSVKNLTGQLIYLGRMELEELRGNLSGCIAVAEFESLWQWTLLPALGAKAVIFLEPYMESIIPRVAAEYKISDVSSIFPRLYVEGEYRDLIRKAYEKNETVSLSYKMVWKNVRAKNIIATIYGSDPKLRREYIVLAAHYDSFSVVPALSPGATDSIGISLLLELARILANNPPPRSVILAAFSGHWQFLAGSRDFAERRLIEMEAGKDDASKILLMIELDISAESKALSVRNFGFGYWIVNTETGILARYGWIKNLLNDVYRSIVSAGEIYEFYDILIGAIPGEQLELTVRNLIREAREAYPSIHDIEPWTISGGLGIVFRTVKSYYRYLLTPFDKYDTIDYNNLIPQIKLISSMLSRLLSVESWSTISTPRYTRYYPPDIGLCKLSVRVFRYNLTEAKYHPVRNILVFAYRSYRGGENRFPFVMAGLTNEEGEISFNGIRYGDLCRVRVYEFNDEGKVISIGPYDGPGSMNPFMIGGYAIIDAHNTTNILPVSIGYNISAIEIYGMEISVSPFAQVGFTLLDARTHYLPQPYIYAGESNPYATVLFAPSNIPVEVMAIGVAYLTRAQVSTIGIISNITEPSLVGSGFYLYSGEYMRVLYPPIRFAQETWNLNEYRLSPYRHINASTQALALTFHEYSKANIELALNYLKRGEIDRAMARAYLSWLYSNNAYTATRSLLMDILQMFTLYILMSLPASYLFIRMVYKEEHGNSGIILTLVLTALLLTIFMIVHPVSILATNVSMTLSGYIALIIGLVVSLIVLYNFYGKLKVIRKERLGIHFIEFERVGVFRSLSGTSLGYMRRRRLITFLTLFPITMVCFSLLNFSTVSIGVRPATTPYPGINTYEGILLAQSNYEPIPIETVSFLTKLFEDKATISIRAWIYPPGGESYITRVIYVDGQPTEKRALLRGIVAIPPEEKEFTINEGILKDGFWFDPEDYRACLISDYIADALDLHRGDTIDVLGIKLIVKGIFDSNLMSMIHDLDRIQLTPIDLTDPFRRGRVPPQYVILIPYNLAKEIVQPRVYVTQEAVMLLAMPTPSIRSIAFKPKEGVDLVKLAEEIVLASNVRAFYCKDDQVWMMVVNPGIRIMGESGVAIVIGISALILLTGMLNSVVVRLKDMVVMSTLGLSPSNIIQMHLLEAAIYSLVGGTIAYALNMLFTLFLSALNISATGLYLNYSASSTLVILAISLLSMIPATLYPAFKTIKMITPSLERRWRISTKPVGDTWNIPLPLRMTNEKDALAFMEYVKEYLDYRASMRVGSYHVLDYKMERESDGANLGAEVQLAPWDHGIIQAMDLRYSKNDGSFNITLKRLSGPRSGWIISNKSFISDIRFQILLWRSLSDSDKRKYYERIKAYGG
ncbi:MAG: M28 family peptidase [Candidatus Bathyarchaeia archaeon]